MAPLLGEAIFALGKGLIRHFFPDPKDQAEADMKLLELKQTGALAELAAETDLAKLQISTNIEEAKSTDVFVAGWRPFVGWVCGFGLAYVAVFEPVGRFIASVLFQYTGDFPIIDTTITLQVLIGMLGLGGLRTFEKAQDVEKNR